MEKGSLKLKLKLGATPEPSTMEGDPAVLTEEEEDVAGEQDVLQHAVKEEAGREKQHKKSKKKKKKKEREKDRHRHKRERSQQEMTSVVSDELGVKKMRVSEDVASTATCSNQPNPVMVAAALQELLMHLLKLLEKKDTNQFFIDPVTDAIAPGYSSIITQPMCFAAMRDKVARGLYMSLKLFEDDVKLIVSNCLKYNGPDTVYYSAGKKLLASAHSLLSRDKLLALRKDMPSMAILPYEIAGVNLAERVAEGGDSGGDDRTDSPNSQDSRSECDDDDDDDDSEEEAARVSAQAASAARAAATALHRAKPTSTMGYLRTNHDGSVGLSFLSGCEGEHSPGSKQPLSMGLVLGKLNAGSSTLHNYHDDKRTMAKPVKPIHYGSYSSFCPSYDSTFANLSKEESDLVRATYGNDTAVQYAESICEFSRDCSMATTLVDQLLNLLTAGQHSRTRATIAAHHHMLQQRAEQQQQHDDKKVTKAVTEGLCSSSTTSNLRSLADLGIDVSFLDTIEHAEQRQQNATSALSHSAALIESLATEQTERLSRQPAHSPLLLPSQPSHTEHRLAEQLTSELVMVARQLPPSALLPIPLPATTT